MNRWLKIPLGLAALGGGGAVLAWSGTATVAALVKHGGGFSVVNLAGAAFGCAAIGFAADCFGWMRSHGDEKKSTVANSVWATRADIERAGLADKPEAKADDQGIYLGGFVDRMGTILLRYRGVKHLLCFGPTSSGKSMSIIVPNVQNLLRSIIVIDPKGDVTAITARLRGRLGKKIVLNPFGVLTKKRPYMKSAGWNPELQLKPKSPNFASHAMCIADAIVEKAGDGGGESGKFFERSAQNLVQALIMWERISNGDDANLCNIPALLTAPDTYDDATPKKLTGGFTFTLQQMALCENDVVRNAANGLLMRLNDKNSQSTAVRDVIETIKSHLGFLTDEKIALDMARGGAIDFGALHRKITTIYLILPTGELHDQAKWLRIFINLALRNLYESAPTDDKLPTLPPVLMLLDEFGNLGRLQEVVKALNMIRSARVQLFFFLQNIGQLTGSYKAELGSFFSGAGAAITFKTGSLDTETAEHLAKAFGNREETVPTQTPTGGTSNTPQAIPLIRPEDISRLEAGTTINLIEPCPWPVKALVPVYAKTKFNEGLDPNPTYFG